MRVGLVGASYAVATHLPAYCALPEIEVVAVATASQESADRVASEFGIARAYAGFEALCADPDVDLVDVATRPSRHSAMVLAALGAGKHVLCEAPLALDADEGRRLVAASQQAERLAVVDMQSRFNPSLWELRRRVRDGWIGDVENVSVRAFYPTFTRPDAVASSAWCADEGTGASTLRVHGLHTADLVGWVFGSIGDVAARAAVTRPRWPLADGDVTATSHDSVSLVGTLPGGAVYSQHSSWVAWHGQGWDLAAHGSEGALFARAAGHTSHFPATLTGGRFDEAQAGAIEPSDDAFDVTEVPVDAPYYPFARLARRLAQVTTAEHDSFQGRVAAARALDLPGFDDGLAMLELAEAAETSAAPTG